MACCSAFNRVNLWIRTPAHSLRTCRMIAGWRKSKIANKTGVQVVQIKRRGEFLYGVAPCLAAMQANRRKIYNIYMKPGVSVDKRASKRSALGEIWKCAEKKAVEVLRVDKNTLESLSGKKPHQGIVLDVAPLNFRSMGPAECKISPPKREECPLWLVLDEVQDPMNLGAILRGAYFLGVDRVITSGKHCCPLSPAVSKASSGAMELMPVYAVNNLEGFLKEASVYGWTVLGTTSSSLNDELKEDRFQCEIANCSKYVVDGPTMVVLGNEGFGLHSGIKKVCTTMLTVQPCRQLPEGFDSLNVAVATGIILHSLQSNKKS